MILNSVTAEKRAEGDCEAVDPDRPLSQHLHEQGRGLDKVRLIA
jgi:hypothetical protein